MFPRQVTISEAAQFSAASVADFHAIQREERATIRAKLVKRAAIRSDLKAGALAFAVVLAGALAVLAVLPL